MHDPITDIENRQAQLDIGTMGYRIYLGARTDGANLFQAWITLVAFYAAIMSATKLDDDEA